MKIKINVSEILEVLNKIKHIAKPEKSYPIFNSGLFQTHDDRIKITVSNLINSAVVDIPAEVIVQGSCLIDVNQLVAILSTMNGEVEIEDKPENSIVWIKNKKTKCRLNALNVKDFSSASFAIKNPDIEFSISSKALHEGLQKSVKFTDSHLHSIMSGVFADIKNNIIKFAALDGARLAVIVKTIKNNDINAGFIIPKNTVFNILPMLPTDEDVEIKMNSNCCIFQFGNIQYSSALLKGTFPKYENIIPKEHVIDFSVAKEDLKRVLERIEVVETKEDKCCVFFTVIDRTLTAEAKDYKCNDVMDLLDKNGGDIAFKVNRTFLGTVLSVLNGDTIKFLMNTPKDAILIPDMEHTFIIMPMR